MQEFLNILLDAGRTAVDLVLYVLLPIMVVMMAMMKLLEERGILDLVARPLAPILRLVGIPGLGVFAILQLMFVSFAAPVATLSLMDERKFGEREIAATLAMVFTMSQANAVFPLAAVGLSIPAILVSSIAGGAVASALAYYCFARHIGSDNGEQQWARSEKSPRGIIATLEAGGLAGVRLVAKSIPILILAIFTVKMLEWLGAIALLETGLAPVFSTTGVPTSAVLPLATKYVAGGTAMTGIVLNLVQSGNLSVAELNRMAGFLINPLDLVGFAVIVKAGERVKAVAKPAVMGAAVGIVVRGLLHLLVF